MDLFKCEFCHKEQNTLYEGWFYTNQKFNPFAQGTASAGLMQKRLACRDCTQKAIDNGYCMANEIPNDESTINNEKFI